MDRGPTDGEPRVGLEVLGEVGRVQARVLPARERQNLLPHGGGAAAPRGAAPIPVAEGSAALAPQPGEKPPDVPETQPEALGRLGSREPAIEDQLQGMETSFRPRRNCTQAAPGTTPVKLALACARRRIPATEERRPLQGPLSIPHWRPRGDKVGRDAPRVAIVPARAIRR